MAQFGVTFNCGEITLEGALEIPEGKSIFPGVVLCHPHPLYGGDMNNNVITAVSRSLSEQGSASLRFHFRGAGNSEGYFADGIGEQEDAKAALYYLSNREEINQDALGLLGYSFGGMVALPVGINSGLVKALAAISPVIPEDLQWDMVKPVYIIWGTEDHFVPPPTEEEMEKLPSNVKLEMARGASHFWWGNEKKAAAKIADFFQDNL